MCHLESYRIDLKGLRAGETLLEYTPDDAFFRAIDAPEVSSGQLHVSVTIRKSVGFFELLFHTEGTVQVPCDLCLDDMDQPVEVDNRLVVKLGATYDEEDDIVTVAEDEGILDLSWFIYEFVVLAVPVRHVHAPGKCNPAMTKVLEELSTDRSSDEESTMPTDPRWAALAALKTKD